MNKRHYIIPIFVPHEGCPHNCVFCNQNTITGNSNLVNGEFVINIVEEYLKTIDREKSIIEISFFGGTFTAINIDKQKELLSVAKSYKDRGKIDFIRLSTRPDYIDEFILDNLKTYGVDIIELGVQSMDDNVLKLSGRGHDYRDVFKASKLIKKYNFLLGHQIMPGLPGSNFEKDIYTAREVIKLKPDICRIYPALVIRDTPMEKMYISNTYNPYTLDKAVEVCKKIYGMMYVNNINVIRIGLQPTEEINIGKELIAGPFHPAFRELVQGSIYNDMILSVIPKQYKGVVFIEVNNKDISKLYANKKEYFNAMKVKNPNCIFKVSQNINIPLENINIKFNDKLKSLSMYNYFLQHS
ncbi:radical SAM domain-containing protein [Clostridium pasteurianum DSM 525 = ATCC 6013]|uniref:Radical SAM domain protein n=1 Tax=Clostridium pasteurianum DSM 525 = ATCC 6013 TaxID=1262449 RepID=A0A0H3J2J5_CLOPA|nr:radical SAM protein [Clostridium pasteurianum]AJA48146.1 radical SAM domain-containing protein [Clostridium pasteurianum DSM 525 = ATCC 6013]AJA52134.1 radical SAM domain-containing protein [Clostridium pasteurianum DSM 525 = ATCC 6013]AOZ75409.1 radical SAM protein [Clostridium pasteurianum DSM 525 = ATCC 6013]AOZ79204.1 radical SAM protein [Clostridium pasteurianum]ELP60702.1 bioB/LipA-like protein [Clostridium pasteurianum DSM 525 = ATCC 6013]